MNKPAICVSIVDSEFELIPEIEKQVDLFEVRIDLIGPEWPKVIKYLKKPWIACNRRQEEGGKGDPDESKRIEILLQASEAGADIVDIEYHTVNLADYVLTIKKRSRCLISYPIFRVLLLLAHY
jgi:3-dehydroquinate dehydratase I